MKKYMKSTLKKVIVKCGKFWQDEIEVDSFIFDDVLLEAATQAVEKRKNLPGLKVTVVMECWEKKKEKNPMAHFCYNTYFILINCGLHDKAESLKQNFIREHGIDMSKDPIRGENNV